MLSIVDVSTVFHMPKTAVSIVPEVIERVRIRRGLLCEDLARQAGVSRSSLQRAMRTGAVGMSVGRRLAAALGIPFEAILPSPETAETPHAARAG